ncbi:MAG TPA: TonB-dependent receptor [Hyphomonadaceae bacterium]|nr:TonB-dependent receptor [Hyphomonadaceae bacterium]
MSLKIPFNRALLLTAALIAPPLAEAQVTSAAPQESVEQGPPQEEAGQEDVVVVRGEFIPEPMQVTSEVATFLTNEDLQRTGDDNAALALTRLTGLSVVSNRFVYVRGLGDRYSSALLNGSPLPSPEPLRRQVPLDLFPSNILEGAAVQKTFSPNYPGEFGGGIIDLTTLRKPVSPFLTMKLGTGYAVESTNRRGYTYYGGDIDWLGIDNGVRDIPEALGHAIGLNKRIDDSNFTPDELETIGESLTNAEVNVVQSEKLYPDFEGEISAGTSFAAGDGDVGLIGVVGFDNTWRTKRSHRTEVVGNALESDFDVVTTANDIVFNAFGSANYSIGDNDLTLSGLFVRSTTKYGKVEEGFDLNLPGADPTNPANNERVEATAWYERELADVQIAGAHEMGDLAVKWRGSFAQSTRDAPYERDIRYDIVNGGYVFGGGGGLGNRLRFTELTDQVASAGVDASYTFPIGGGRDATILAGGAYANTTRDSQLYQFSWTGPRGPTPIDVLTARVDYLLSPDNIDPQRFVLNEFTGQDDSYKGRLTNTAFYVGSDIELIPYVRTAIGVRYEDASELVRTYNRFGVIPADPVNLDNTYWLPAATATWNFADDLQLRVGYSQTMARPQFRELARTPFIDPDTDRVYEGNPFLVDSEFRNYDARVEYYFGNQQFVTAGAFYKQIENPIEEVVIRVDRYQTRFINAPEATLAGAELEYRLNFTMPFDIPFMSDADWLFAINYTYTKSEVNAGPGSTVISPIDFQPVPASVFELDGTPLQGTPEHIANLQFGYELPESQLTLIVGWLDSRILRRGQGSVEPVIEDPGFNVDLVYKHDFEFNGTNMTLNLAGRNLTGTVHEEYQLYERGRNDVDRYPRGQVFTASITAEY